MVQRQKRWRGEHVSTWVGFMVCGICMMCASVVFAQETTEMTTSPPDEASIVLASPTGVELAQNRPRTRRPRTRQPSRRPRTRQPSRRPRTRRPSSNPRCPRMVSTPVQISAGPAAQFISGPIQRDQVAHLGGRLALTGVMLEETMRQHWQCFPAKYRSMLRRPQEVRVKPLVASLIPSELIVSPKIKNTGIYGIGWHLIGVGVAPISGPVRFDIKLSLPIKYMYIHSDTLFDGPMHFLRPGLEGKAELEFLITKDFLFSLGWASQLFIPQRVGGPIFELGSIGDSIWHIGQAFFKLHLRVPYETPMPR